MANASLAPTRAHSYPEKIGKWLFEQSRNWRTVLGFLLVAALTYISIRFNIELGKLSAVDETSKQLLPAGYGLLDLAALFLSGFVGLKTRSPVRKLIAWVWFGFLLCLSLWAAASFTLSVDERLEHQETYHAIESKQAELATQAKNVELWQTNLANTTLYKTRYTGLLNNEQEKYRQIQSELEALEGQLPPASQAIYQKVAPALGLTPEFLAMIVRLLWAGALTLSPIILVLLIAVEFGLITPHTSPSGTPPKGTKKKGFTDWFHKNKSKTGTDKNVQPSLAPVASTEPHEVHPNKKQKPARERAPQGLQKDTGTLGKAGNRYSELKKSVLAGRTRPSVRAIRTFCGCNQTVANRYIDSLASEGVIERSGQGWKLRQLRVVGGRGNA